MPNPAQELAELRDASDVLLQQTSAAQSRLGPVQAADDSGEVTVRLGADGMLEAVQVGFNWAQRLTVVELAAAVLVALGQARAARLEQYGEAINEVAEEPAPRARPSATHPVVGRFHERLATRDGDSKAAAELVTEMLTDADLAVTEANRILDEHAHRTFHGRSRSGRVTATASGSGDLSALDIDAAWGAKAHPANLGREITDAVRAAGQRAQREGLAAAVRASRLAQLARELTDDR